MGGLVVGNWKLWVLLSKHRENTWSSKCGDEWEGLNLSLRGWQEGGREWQLLEGLQVKGVALRRELHRYLRQTSALLTGA